MKIKRKIFLAGAAALLLLSSMTAGLAAPQTGGETAGNAGIQPAQAAAHKVCLMWQQPKPEQKKLIFPGRPAGVNVVSPCWFNIADEQGKITAIAEADPAYVRAAKQSGMKIWPLVTSGGFDAKTTAKLLRNPEGREKAAANLVRLAKLYELDGLNLDFENISYRDRDALTSFVTELSRELHKASLTVSVDITAPSADPDWSMCYDRKALAAQADYVMLMSYDEYYAGSSKAGPVAELSWVAEGIRATLQEGVPKEKLLLGMPLYMRLWSEKDGRAKSRTLHMPEAQQLWQQKQAKRSWVPESGLYYYEYTEQGTRYRVWQEDARSLALKSALISQYDLAGAALWKKGVETEDVWPVLAAALENAER